MNAMTDLHLVRTATLAQAIETACAGIAPTWPLDQFIAVNPYWGHVAQPVEAVSAQLASLSGTPMTMPRAYYAQAWQAGRLRSEHLEAALADAQRAASGQGSSLPSMDELRAALTQAAPAARPLPLATTLVDAQRDLSHAPSWTEHVTHQVSQTCASYFDEQQARWHPDKSAGLYATWLQLAELDRAPRLLLGLKGHNQRVRALPRDPMALISEATAALGVAPERAHTYFSALLLSINGWAAWCAWQRWQAGLNQPQQLANHIELDGARHLIVELLAVRLAWEWLLAQAEGLAPPAALQAEGLGATLPAWLPKLHHALAAHEATVAQTACEQRTQWMLQRALELAYQQPLCAALAGELQRQRAQDAAPVRPAAEQATRPTAQAVFCIDVRSEVFRRALEAADSGIATRGFAGFFGLPIAYNPLGSGLVRPQLPGLLAPALTAVDDVGGPEAQADGLPLGQALARRRQLSLQAAGRWQAFRGAASSAFSFVEACGLAYSAKLLKGSLGLAQPEHATSAGLSPQEMRQVKPSLPAPADASALLAQVDTAAAVLGAMGLVPSARNPLARLVLLAGHGSDTANNPHAAGLDCGACGGQTGEVNARVLAGLLNHPEVRVGLATIKGIQLPGDTWFVAGLHNTTTDEVPLFDADELPASHADDLARLRLALAAAGLGARAERAASLGLAEVRDGYALGQAVRAKSNDWAETRPEWGLANNAAFVVAPRQRTQALNLQGRSFLHDYDWQVDAGNGYSLLELIMTAPMVVTNWINLQYYASTVDNLRYGSGNKVLHNVVGATIGVFEGNGGDLRIGLPLQSLHDGQRWMHEPLRLSVFIEAPQAAIDAIIDKHAVVAQLVTNGWLHLFRLDGEAAAVERRTVAGWVAA
jgi:uncharacterized protein YbcC (UPF0753/DUF2309 family)